MVQKKILNHFDGKLKIEPGVNVKGNIIFFSSLSYSEVMSGETDEATYKEISLKNAALLLRKSLTGCTSSKLGTGVSYEDLQKGECEIPLDVQTFFELLICGPKKRKIRA